MGDRLTNGRCGGRSADRMLGPVEFEFGLDVILDGLERRLASA